MTQFLPSPSQDMIMIFCLATVFSIMIDSFPVMTFAGNDHDFWPMSPSCASSQKCQQRFISICTASAQRKQHLFRLQKQQKHKPNRVIPLNYQGTKKSRFKDKKEYVKHETISSHSNDSDAFASMIQMCYIQTIEMIETKRIRHTRRLKRICQS